MENWNRYYDPSIGRYLQPEPLMRNPWVFVNKALSGLPLPNPYAYAANNPLFYSDPSGFDISTRNCDEKVRGVVKKLTDSLRTTKNCDCMKKLKDLDIVRKIVEKEDHYIVECWKGKIEGQGDACGFGEHHDVDVSTRKNCGCFAKTLIHEMLHTDPDARTHSPDNKPKQDSSFDDFNAAEACINCDGTVKQ